MEREGGLRLCACGHPLAFHPALPEYYQKDAPMQVRCTFCDCTEPHEGEFQGFRFKQGGE